MGYSFNRTPIKISHHGLSCQRLRKQLDDVYTRLDSSMDTCGAQQREVAVGGSTEELLGQIKASIYKTIYNWLRSKLQFDSQLIVIPFFCIGQLHLSLQPLLGWRAKPNPCWPRSNNSTSAGAGDFLFNPTACFGSAKVFGELRYWIPDQDHWW